MREPGFWRGEGGACAALLAPVAAVYGAFAAWRMARPGWAAGIPVVCVGNFTLGGAGKTPTALAVGRMLTEAGRRPFFLSRGHGGRLAGPVRVDPGMHAAAEVGDEPLLLARLAPTIVARDRMAGAQAARAQGAGVVVMDDGFQNPSLEKSLSIVVVDGARGIGNGRVFPAGPLRAPLDAQLDRAHAVLVVGEPGGAASVLEAVRRRGLALFHARLAPDPQALDALRAGPVLAFAGIGDPDKVFRTLEAAGVEVRARRPFPDHHRFSRSEAAGLLAHAERERLALVTTEKDHARLAGEPDLAALAAAAKPLPVMLEVEEAAAFRSLVLEHDPEKWEPVFGKDHAQTKR